MNSSIKSCLLICLFLWGCSDQKIDTATAKKEMESREIKKVSDADILSKVTELGESRIDSLLRLEEKSVNGSDQIQFYAFEREHALDGKAQQLFSAYNYNYKNSLESEPTVQKINNGTEIIYAWPTDKGVWFLTYSRKEVILSLGD